MRIFATLEDVTLKCSVIAPTKLSLNPFKSNCFFLDLEDGKEYSTCQIEGKGDILWKPYNVECVSDTCLYNPETGENISIYDYYNYYYNGSNYNNYMIVLPNGIRKDLSEFKGFEIYGRIRKYKEGKIIEEKYESIWKFL